jgi:hypothetical protein
MGLLGERPFPVAGCGMKFRVPGRGLSAISFMTLVSWGFVYGAYVQWKNVPLFLENEKGTDLGVLILSFFFGLGVLSALIHEFGEKYPYGVWGEKLMAAADFVSGDSVIIGPFHGLDKTALLIDMDFTLPPSLRQHVSPFRYYRKLPPVPEIRCGLQLVGVTEGQEVVLQKRDVAQGIASVWGSGEAREGADGCTEIEFPVEGKFDYYQLKLALHIDPKMPKVNDVNPPEPGTTRLRVKLALPPGKQADLGAISLRAAKATVMSSTENPSALDASKATGALLARSAE